MFLSRDIGAARGAGDDFWYSPVGSGISASGAHVTTDTAMRLSTVYKCVRVRAETIGMLPLMIYRRTGDGGKNADSAHPLYGLLHDAPNPWMTAMQWRQMMQSHLDLRGNAYAQQVFDGAGRLDMLVPLNPDTVTVEVLPNGVPRYKVRTEKGDRVLVFGEVLHVAGLSADGYVGMNPIEMARESIGAGLSARDYGARYFGNSARAPAWIKMAGRFATSEARAKFVQDFSRAYGGMNSGKTPIMEGGMELQAFPAVTNVDAQFLELRQYSDIDIAGLYRMPPHKLGILDRATWGNIEHQQLDFVTDAIMPSCVAWEQALMRDLDFGVDSFPEFKLAGLLRGDTRTRYEAYGKGIQDGWLTRNEARGMENMNPLDGLDEPLEPLNMTPAGSRGVDQARGTQPTGERRAALAVAAAERVARKECAMWRKDAPVTAEHGRWLAEVLAVSETTAAGCVDALPGIFAEADTSMPDAEFTSARAAELLRLEN